MRSIASHHGINSCSFTEVCLAVLFLFLLFFVVHREEKIDGKKNTVVKIY